MTEIAIESHDLTKQYRGKARGTNVIKALGGVSLRVEPGQIFGLLGQNGAGKTTFIKILLGIIAKTSGEATVFGKPAGSIEARRKIGYLPEQMRFPWHHTAYSALDYYGQLSGMTTKEIHERRDELLTLVGIQARAKDRVVKFSKGMVQRLGLAQAMIHRPPLLILDEPTDGLDPRARAEVRGMLNTLKQQGVTIFLNSHLLQEVEVMCDRIAILDRGQLRFSGTAAELREKMKSEAEKKSLQIKLRVQGDISGVQVGEIASWNQVRSETVGNELRLDFMVDHQDALDQIVDFMRAKKLSILELQRNEGSFEDAFLRLTDTKSQN